MFGSGCRSAAGSATDAMEGVHPNAAAGVPAHQLYGPARMQGIRRCVLSRAMGMQVNREQAQRRQAGRQHD
ncbi:hypothetical protein [Xylella fastidiosa]|uniref:hypothetical protein n=1 Tax=Xylella fastidiosa TaxID=2371 RepID=UPI00241787EE|nr:hypothetical protein [Xylella fastidiosa]MDG4872194.1 hypothetical protein [Xylella fastidiosa subsp. multiplex]